MMQNQATANPGFGACSRDRINAFIASVSDEFFRIARRSMEIAEKRRQRRALSKLDDHLLRDIGISREQAAREARRLF